MAKATTDPHAIVFFNRALEYQKAATQVMDRDPSLTNPINFLYFHTMELALKAFLRSQNLPVVGTKRMSHKLTDLYAECRGLGLTIGSDDRIHLGNIVSLLEHGNLYHGFRYFNPELAALADLSWTREVVEQLIRAIQPYVEDRASQDALSTAAVKSVFTFGKLMPQGSADTTRDPVTVGDTAVEGEEPDGV
jgi:hypothetical protein